MAGYGTSQQGYDPYGQGQQDQSYDGQGGYSGDPNQQYPDEGEDQYHGQEGQSSDGYYPHHSHQGDYQHHGQGGYPHRFHGQHGGDQQHYGQGGNDFGGQDQYQGQEGDEFGDPYQQHHQEGYPQHGFEGEGGYQDEYGQDPNEQYGFEEGGEDQHYPQDEGEGEWDDYGQGDLTGHGQGGGDPHAQHGQGGGDPHAQHQGATPHPGSTDPAHPDAKPPQATTAAPAHGDAHHDPTHPDAAHHDPAHPDAAQHDPTHPDAAHHDPTHPDAAHHDPTHPDPAHHDPAHPDAAHHDPAHPDAAHHDPAHPDAAHHDPAHPDAAHHDPAHPDAAHPDPTHPDAAHHDPAHPDATHPDAHGAGSEPHSKPGGPTLNIALENTFAKDEKVFAYVIGQAIDQGNKLLLLSSDGKTPYYPSGPGPLKEHIAIEISKEHPTTITIPHLAGGRIYFSVAEELEFSIGNGISLVEPSVTNPSDPNYQKEWGFVELTFNKDQVYANISYVDFVGTIPLGLSLDTEHGTQHVTGMTPDGLAHVSEGLTQQQQHDGKDWDKLITHHKDGGPLRVLSLNQAVTANPALFHGYYDQYIEEVWQHLASNPIHVDTQAAAGVVTGQIHGDTLAIGNAQLHKPTTADVLTCNSGPFATGGDAETNSIIPRVAAAFNRSTFITTDTFPEDKDHFYKADVTNHYARIVHEANSDGKGYAFPYDDVQKTGGPDQSGEVHAASSDVTLMTVHIGGGDAGHAQ